MGLEQTSAPYTPVGAGNCDHALVRYCGMDWTGAWQQVSVHCDQVLSTPVTLHGVLLGSVCARPLFLVY
jgi:hypothetical protein